jgi:hypothetical protein
MTTMENRSAPLWTRGMIAGGGAGYRDCCGVWCCVGGCDWGFVVAAAAGDAGCA